MALNCRKRDDTELYNLENVGPILNNKGKYIHANSSIVLSIINSIKEIIQKYPDHYNVNKVIANVYECEWFIKTKNGVIAIIEYDYKIEVCTHMVKNVLESSDIDSDKKLEVASNITKNLYPGPRIYTCKYKTIKGNILNIPMHHNIYIKLTEFKRLESLLSQLHEEARLIPLMQYSHS